MNSDEVWASILDAQGRSHKDHPYQRRRNSDQRPFRESHDDETVDVLTSEELVKLQPNQDDEIVDIEPSEIYRPKKKRRIHKYTEKEMEEIRKGCETTIVHDHGPRDRYHYTDEQLKEQDVFYDIRSRLAMVKTIYRRADQFVEAMRTVMDAWNILSEKDYLHTKEEFMELVHEGRIYSKAIPRPKLKRMKDYNVLQIINYIANRDLDPSDLYTTKKEGYFEADEEYDEEEEFNRLVPEEDRPFVNEELFIEMPVRNIDMKYMKGYEPVETFRSKRKRKRKKKDYYKELIKRDVHEALRKMDAAENSSDGGGYWSSAFMTDSIFDLDEKTSIFDQIRMNGSWANKDDVWLYNQRLEAALLSAPSQRRRYLTNADEKLEEFFSTLERNGVDVLDLRRNIGFDETDHKIAEKRKAKENKKKEAQLLARIDKMQSDEKFKAFVKKYNKNIEKHMND